MIKHVRMAAGARADEEKVRAFCEQSLEHFAWISSHGVEFRESYVAEKTTHPFGDDCLFYSGNEEVYPFAEAAVPAPRGHKPRARGRGGRLSDGVPACARAILPAPRCRTTARRCGSCSARTAALWA